MRKSLIIWLLTLCANSLYAQYDNSLIIGSDTLTYRYTPIDQSNTSTRGGGSGRSIFEPIPVGEDGNISFMVAPAYSAETNLRLAAAVKYWQYAKEERLVEEYMRRRVCDISLMGSASISGFYNIAVEGTHPSLGRSGRHTVSYGAEVCSEPSRIWGLDYDTALAGNRHNYTEKEYSAWLRYDILVGPVTIGLYADYRCIDAVKLDEGATSVLQKEQLALSTSALGVRASYASRSQAQYSTLYEGGIRRGIYAMVEAIYRPRLLSNIAGDLWSLRAIFDYYQPLWRGALLALDIYGEIDSANTPWLLSAQLGSDSRMRGYYAGRFRGNTLISAQLELRQRIWRGLGIVAWGGAGEAFSANDAFEWRKLLPSYGAGLRYSYYNLTVRFDAAFGREGATFILGINEAF